MLKEPAKQAVLAYTPGSAIPREALVIVLDRPANRTFEAVVDITGAKLASWREVKGVQPVVLESRLRHHGPGREGGPRGRPR